MFDLEDGFELEGFVDDAIVIGSIVGASQRAQTNQHLARMAAIQEQQEAERQAEARRVAALPDCPDCLNKIEKGARRCPSCQTTIVWLELLLDEIPLSADHLQSGFGDVCRKFQSRFRSREAPLHDEAIRAAKSLHALREKHESATSGLSERKASRFVTALEEERNTVAAFGATTEMLLFGLAMLMVAGGVLVSLATPFVGSETTAGWFGLQPPEGAVSWFLFLGWPFLAAAALVAAGAGYRAILRSRYADYLASLDERYPFQDALAVTHELAAVRKRIPPYESASRDVHWLTSFADEHGLDRPYGKIFEDDWEPLDLPGLPPEEEIPSSSALPISQLLELDPSEWIGRVRKNSDADTTKLDELSQRFARTPRLIGTDARGDSRVDAAAIPKPLQVFVGRDGRVGKMSSDSFLRRAKENSFRPDDRFALTPEGPFVGLRSFASEFKAARRDHARALGKVAGRSGGAGLSTGAISNPAGRSVDVSFERPDPVPLAIKGTLLGCSVLVVVAGLVLVRGSGGQSHSVPQEAMSTVAAIAPAATDAQATADPSGGDAPNAASSPAEGDLTPAESVAAEPDVASRYENRVRELASSPRREPEEAETPAGRTAGSLSVTAGYSPEQENARDTTATGVGSSGSGDVLAKAAIPADSFGAAAVALSNADRIVFNEGSALVAARPDGSGRTELVVLPIEKNPRFDATPDRIVVAYSRSHERLTLLQVPLDGRTPGKLTRARNLGALPIGLAVHATSGDVYVTPHHLEADRPGGRPGGMQRFLAASAAEGNVGQGEVQTLEPRPYYAYDLEMDPLTAEVYYTDSGPAFNGIRRCRFDGRRDEVLLEGPQANARFLALDLASGTIYFTRRGTRAILALDIETRRTKTLFETGRFDPFDVDLSTDRTKLYWKGRDDQNAWSVHTSNLETGETEHVFEVGNGTGGIAVVGSAAAIVDETSKGDADGNLIGTSP